MNIAANLAHYRRLAHERAAAPRDPGTVAADMIRSTERQAHEDAAARATSEAERSIQQLSALTGCSPDELRAAQRRLVEQSNAYTARTFLRSIL